MERCFFKPLRRHHFSPAVEPALVLLQRSPGSDCCKLVPGSPCTPRRVVQNRRSRTIPVFFLKLTKLVEGPEQGPLRCSSRTVRAY